ncbi:hypothetical protein ARAM_003167 [Aspergillus rambellii]|uniref:Uncharacterized protein n=1 Tax=Aspergillus rambellii TaxID=308745 RepID=A0A0F8U9R5_9EURO|nr:hypothetical protein ARAM_003167 [Aspergillus rambellii]
MTMSGEGEKPTLKNEIQIFEETASGWELRGWDLNFFDETPDANIAVFCSGEFARLCADYKTRFQKEFWSVIDKDINGSFHCEYACTGRVFPKVTWSCYKIKKVFRADEYHWRQPALHIEWDQRTGRQRVYIFDFLPLHEQRSFLDSLPSRGQRNLNPFFWHAALAHVVLEQYDAAFWSLRDLVRGHEKSPKLTKGRKKSSTVAIEDEEFFPELHDIARHVFHYNETIEVAEHTLQRLGSEQMRWRKEDRTDVEKNLEAWIKPHTDLLYQEKSAFSLKTRSKSLNNRHLNEINLGFNLVSQGFGHDARSDSSTMKIIAVVSMVYLPGTFVSGLFGANFFSFQDGWAMASNFWLYWAVTIPLTMGTVLVWALWYWQDLIARYWAKVILGMRKDGSQQKTKKDRGEDGEDKVEKGDESLLRRDSGFSPIRLIRAATTMKRGNIHRKESV